MKTFDPKFTSFAQSLLEAARLRVFYAMMYGVFPQFLSCLSDILCAALLLLKKCANAYVMARVLIKKADARDRTREFGLFPAPQINVTR